MEIGVRELRNETARVIAAVESGEPVTLTVRGRPVADILPHRIRRPSLGGEEAHRLIVANQADPGLRDLLDEVGGTLEDLRPW